MADRSIAVRIQAVVSDFQRGMQQATSDLKGFQGQAKLTGAEMRSAMTTVGLAATGAGLAIAGGLGAGVAAAIKWESAFAGVIKTVDATDAELDVLEQGLRDLAQEIPVTHAELAGIAEAAGQLGVETGNILEFTEVMAALGASTNLTSQEAATMLARFGNITQLPQSQYENLGSAIVDLGNNSETTEREITEMGLRIAGAGNQIGLTEGDILGFAAALSSVGIEAQAGGTAISRVFVEVDKSVRSGGDTLNEFARVAGMSADDFKRAYQEDAAGAIITFIEGLGGISAAGGDVFGVLEGLELQDIRVRDALLRAAGAGDTFRESIERGNTAFEDNTALGREAELRYQTVASQIITMKNALFETGIVVGEVLLPVFVPLITGVRDLAKWFADLPGPVKGAGVVLAGVSATLLTIGGTALILVPRIMQLVAAWKTLNLTMAASGAAGAAGSLGRGAGMLGKGAGVAALAFGGIQVGEFAAEKLTGKPGDFFTSVGSIFGSDSATSSLRMTEAIHNINEALQQGREPALAFQDSLAHLANSGDLTTTSLLELATAAGVTIDDADAFASSMEDMARDAGLSEDAIQVMVDAILGVGPGAEDAADGMDDYSDSTDTATTSTYDFAEAQRDAIAAINEAFSPISAAIGAIGRLQEAEANLQTVRDDSESTAEDVAAAEWAYVDSLFAAQGALDAVDPTQLDAALAGIADALGISTDEAADLLEVLGVLDGMSVESVVTTTFKTKGSGLPPSFGNNVSGRAAGGPVTADEVFRVGEGNMPELLKTSTGLFMIPGDSGRVFSNPQSQQMFSGGDRNLNVTFINPRLADDPMTAVRTAFAFDSLATVGG